MKYAVEKNESYLIVKILDSNLNASLAPKLKAQLIIFKNEGNPSIIIDLRDVKYIDSSGLSALLTGKRLWEGEGSYVISGPFYPTVSKIFSISKLETVLNIVPTIDESINFVAMENLDREVFQSSEGEN